MRVLHRLLRWRGWLGRILLGDDLLAAGNDAERSSRDGCPHGGASAAGEGEAETEGADQCGHPLPHAVCGSRNTMLVIGAAAALAPGWMPVDQRVTRLVHVGGGHVVGAGVGRGAGHGAIPGMA